MNQLLNSPATAPVIVGRYALYDEIAVGGMASIHLGRIVGDAGFSRTVAIKRLHPQFAKNPEFVAMLIDEGRLAERIRHSNVVAILDVVSKGTELLLVMEYVHGEAFARMLSALAKRGEPVPLAYASAVLVGALQGLHAAHEATDSSGSPLGIVHRDVSPENILVGADGVARVLDFGIALAANRVQTTKEGQLKGKLAYMSPEQIASATVTRATDVYAAGVILWETLAGRRLFSFENEGALVMAIVHGNLAPPSSHRPEISAELDAIVMKALERDPARRFATAEDFATALETAIRPAPAREIARWVALVARETLDRRAGLISRIESRQSLNDPTPVEPPSTPLGPEKVVEIPSGGTSAGSSISTIGFELPRNRTRPIVVAAFLGGMAILLVAGLFLLRSSTTPTAASQRPAASASAATGTATVGAPPPMASSVAADAATALGSASATTVPHVGHSQRPVGSGKPPQAIAKTSAPPPATNTTVIKPGCNPNFVIDAKGVKRFKKECM